MLSISTMFLTAFKRVGIVISSIIFIPRGIVLKRLEEVVDGLRRIVESGDRVDNKPAVSS